jgi:hypothetical protein
MSIVISDALVLSPVAASLSLNNPLILYRNFVTAAGVTATSAEDDYPVSNLANPLTFPDAGWRATSTAEQVLTFTITDIDGPDAAGIAAHNFGTAEIGVKVERYVDSAWETLFDGMPASDAPLMWHFDKVSTAEMRITLASGNAPAQAAVVMIGPALVAQRRIWMSHTPITMGVTTTLVNGMSQAGDFLGTTVLGEYTSTTIDLKNLTPDWYREYFDPFVRAAKTLPFFFAWRPVDYPNEVGFCWLTGNPKPVNQRRRTSATGQDHGLMSVQLAVNGIV